MCALNGVRDRLDETVGHAGDVGVLSQFRRIGAIRIVELNKRRIVLGNGASLWLEANGKLEVVALSEGEQVLMSFATDTKEGALRGTWASGTEYSFRFSKSGNVKRRT